MLILCQIASYLTIEIKNDVPPPAEFFAFGPRYLLNPPLVCAFILLACIPRGVREPFIKLHACMYTYTRCARARAWSAPSVRARADAWVRATRERCAGRLFRYCCYCWGNNRPSIGRLGTMYLFRCGQRCSIDQDPPFASVEKAPRRPVERSSSVSRCAFLVPPLTCACLRMEKACLFSSCLGRDQTKAILNGPRVSTYRICMKKYIWKNILYLYTSIRSNIKVNVRLI